MPDSEGPAAYLYWAERGAIAIEVLAIVLIVGFILTATLSWLVRAVVCRKFTLEHHDRFRSRLGRTLVLGLEILVAADIVRTVALEPTLINTATLGLLVLIRTFLSWSIVLEVEGRWPWQPRRIADKNEERL